ncbi:MAG: hypothetical protein ACREHD_04935 [Pirellulales bacterium]
MHVAQAVLAAQVEHALAAGPDADLLENISQVELAVRRVVQIREVVVVIEEFVRFRRRPRLGRRKTPRCFCLLLNLFGLARHGRRAFGRLLLRAGRLANQRHSGREDQRR